MADRLRIIVCGMVGQHPLGGVAWDYFHYVLGLAELGHDVYYHEDTWCWVNDPVLGYPSDDPTYTANFLRGFFEQHAPHLKDRWHYVHLHDKHFGMSAEKFDEIARTADVFLNVSGASMFPDNLHPRCIKVFMDTDPGYNQIVMETRPAWSENVDRWIEQVRSHDRHLTYAENIYADDCILPRVGIDWRPTRCVVTLEPWRQFRDQYPSSADSGAAFTTVMSWSYFKGPLVYKGTEYGVKGPEFHKFMKLPQRVDVPLAVAVTGHTQPAAEIEASGWRRIDAAPASRTGQQYLNLIRDSLGEWSIAKNCYVATRSGWFSCRTACYLAAGRPAVVQDTGWSKYVPSGDGVIAFATMEESVDGLQRVTANAAHHRRAAYDVAREYLAPDRVLPPMVETVFAPTRKLRDLPPSIEPSPRPSPKVLGEGDRQ